jgi:hypothetical protein
VSWAITNGPTGNVSVLDMFTKDTSAILDNFTRDSGTQNWKVVNWPNEPFRCYKINSAGCDVVVAKI